MLLTNYIILTGLFEQYGKFTGWLLIDGLDRRRLHIMMLVQRKVLETSITL